MKALSIHAPYVYEILEGTKTEEFRTWQPKERGRILICSSAKKYEGFVSGYALCTAEIGNINEYRNQSGLLIEYGWELKNLEYIEPFPVKGKLHLFDVDDALIHTLKGVGWRLFSRTYYELLRAQDRREMSAAGSKDKNDADGKTMPVISEKSSKKESGKTAPQTRRAGRQESKAEDTAKQRTSAPGRKKADDQLNVVTMVFRMRIPWAPGLKEKCLVAEGIAAILQSEFCASVKTSGPDAQQIIRIGLAAIVPDDTTADGFMDEISSFVRVGCGVELIEEVREIR